jgi:hypothetical protein
MKREKVKALNGGTIQYQFKIDKDGNVEDDILYHYIKKDNISFSKGKN